MTDLAQKIDELFVLRRLPEMCDSAGISWESAFVNSLKELQSDIYQLDKYLESSWELDDDILQHHWQIIFRRLEGMNVDSAYISGNLEEISLYEKREKDMRLGIYPNPGDLPDLYYIKSCDVHLLRRLINQKSQGESHYCPENAWVLFDLVTEILDDLEDIGEDCETYNANTLLVSILIHGIPDTVRAYRKFAADLKTRARQLEIPDVLRSDISAYLLQINESLDPASLTKQLPQWRKSRISQSLARSTQSSGPDPAMPRK